MVTEDQIITRHLLHLLQVLAIEMVVHHGRSTVCECPLLVRLPLVSNAARTLCLSHKKGEGVLRGRLFFHRDVCLRLLLNVSSLCWLLRLLLNAFSLCCLSLVVQESHKRGRPDAPLAKLFVT